MPGSQQAVKVKESDLELIECNRQPGKLRISKHACALRYLKVRSENSKQKRNFGTRLQFSLSICLTCPEGRLAAEKVKKK